MTLKTIITVPNALLRKKAAKVTNFDKNLKKLIDDMVETMRDAPGVGLAAPQIGILEQVIVVEFGDEEDEEVPPKLYAVVNPEIVRASEETVFGVDNFSEDNLVSYLLYEDFS
jgi:peptide deformylase